MTVNQIETPEERVDFLDEETVRSVLVKVVKTIEDYGAHPAILKELNNWSLLSNRVADLSEDVDPSLMGGIDAILKAKYHDPIRPAAPVEAPKVSVKVEKYRDLIGYLSQSLSSLATCREGDNVKAEACWVIRCLKELTEADCPRAKDRDKQRAELLISRAKETLTSKGF